VPRIFHITSHPEWDTQKSEPAFTAPSLESEGFIHASHANQIVDTANRIFSGRTDLVILVIDPALLTSPLKIEDSYGHGSFPHIYGTIEKVAITEVVTFSPKPDGSFDLPDQIQE
jgi:uncharacterized protein (DUF952 family)